MLYLRKLLLKLPVILFDIGCIPLAWYTAYWLRYNLHPFPGVLTSTSAYLALGMLTTVQVGCYYYYKTYRGLWRFSSLNDVLRIVKAVSAATILAVLVFYLTAVLHHLPRAVFPLYTLILTSLLCGGRLGLRLFWDKNAKVHADDAIHRVLIVGAGRAGESLARDLKRSHHYLPLGFVDDNVLKRGQEVHGITVLGKPEEIPALVKQLDIDLIVIAIPSAGSATMRRIVGLCEASEATFRTLPGILDLIEGRVEMNALRPVNLEDLLGRDQIHLEWDKIAASLADKRVLISGGGGSIGSELCRQIKNLQPRSLAIVDHSEYNLYLIEQELQNCGIPLYLSLNNVTDEVAMKQLFADFDPQIVFHAAAYKHVPMLQNQVRTAVLNNVLGTQIMAKASLQQQVEKFILISSDKAVNPTNIMGTTKRVAEMYCQNLNAFVRTQFITVRFGNVLGSAGSVVPLFQKQLQQGGPLTITHPDVQRYFMTIPEACQLILQAMTNGEGGEIFVLDMGEPIKISYLAEQMIKLAGKTLGQDINIKYTGLRPGEKLYEELFHASEQLSPTAHEKLFKARFRALDWQELDQTMRLLQAACTAYQEDELLVLLKSLVPEFALETMAL